MIIDADVEHLLIDYLNEQLPLHSITDFPVADRVPQQGYNSVTLIRTGGVRRDLVTDEAQVTLDTRAASNTQCVLVANLCRALLLDLWGGRKLNGHAVYQVRELSGPYSNPTETDIYRYSQSFLVAVRAREVV